jgi:hypothetical protein
LPYDPTEVIAEILGRRAVAGANPSVTDFCCPYTGLRCSKRSTNLQEEPYPVCSLHRGPRSGELASGGPVFVCPKRFHQVDFLADVVKHCWFGKLPQNPVIAPEVKMAGFGNVDFVVADLGQNGEVLQFLSVELQAIDITGTVFPAYQAIRSGEMLKIRPTYGFNWDNVYKRYITQLIRKGYFHHHWKSRIVAVIPDQVYGHIKDKAGFLRTSDIQQPEVNIVFMSYRLDPDPLDPFQYRPRLVTVEGTSHANLQNAILYKEAPDISAFSAQILRSLERAKGGGRMANLDEEE